MTRYGTDCYAGKFVHEDAGKKADWGYLVEVTKDSAVWSSVVWVVLRRAMQHTFGWRYGASCPRASLAEVFTFQKLGPEHNSETINW